MSKQNEEDYKGCKIFTVAVPTSDGKWSAVADIQRLNVAGIEIFQDVTNASLADNEDSARALARTEAMRRIDEMLADPRG